MKDNKEQNTSLNLTVELPVKYSIYVEKTDLKINIDMDDLKYKILNHIHDTLSIYIENK